jgi:hypothetical protein
MKLELDLKYICCVLVTYYFIYVGPRGMSCYMYEHRISSVLKSSPLQDTVLGSGGWKPVTSSAAALHATFHNPCF